MIRIDEESVGDGARPDLYIDVGGGHRSYIEAKAPRSLQLFYNEDTREGVGRAVDQSIKKGSRQINRNHPGSLLIVSSISDDKIRKETQERIHLHMQRRGKLYSSMKQVISIHSGLAYAMRHGKDSLYIYEHKVSRDIVDNPYAMTL